jgi:tRNA pseudouridine55 synthase
MGVVRRVRRAAGGTKTGHAGTLDPLATGVVICCLGKATRYVEQLMGLTKVYDATVDLSAFTATDDREGDRQEIAVPTAPLEFDIHRACAKFLGQIQQRPPAFSAIHVQGVRAYKLARGGQTLDLPPRTVRIDRIDILKYTWPTLSIRITCGRGTYIRSLARDLGLALNTGGHLASLRRTAVGPYTLSQAVPITRLDHTISQSDLLPIPTA